MKSIIVFIVTMLFFACIAWLAGYNFDQRNEGVAAYFVFALILSLIAPITMIHEDI